MKIARYLGCRGAHQHPDGNWMPCSDHETLTRISNEAEEKSRKKKKKKHWENLEESGIVGIDTLPDGSLVSAPIAVKRVLLYGGVEEFRQGIASTEIELDRNAYRVKQQASTTRSSGNLSKEIEKALKAKVTSHNKRMKDLNKSDWSMTNVGQLRSVYLRGAGAYMTSHRPGTTKNQWAMARVNAFLKILSTGRPSNLNYMSDSDLLPDKHPWKKRGKSDSSDIQTKGRRFIRSVNFDPNARDADGDGIVQDATRFQRPARPRIPKNSQPQLDLTPDQPAKPVARASRPRRRVVMPDYFKKIGYQPGPPMVTTPQNTKRRFIYKGRRYDNERYAKVHQKISDAIIGSVTKKRDKNQQKTMWVLGGMPGSYKSSMRREGFMGIPDRDAAAHIDPDEVKEMIPEYLPWVSQGETGAADYVHKESRDIANNVLQRAADEDLDIVYDTSGLFNRGYKTLSEARGMGYKVVAHYTTGELDTLIEGIKARQEATGRFVPSGIPYRVARDIPEVVKGILEQDLFDEFYLWDTTEAGKRVPVAKKMAGGSLDILNKTLWERFLNGGK